MFSVHCPTHGSEVLLSERRITAVRNTPEGIRVGWRCRCGTEGSFLTGRTPAAMVGRVRTAF